MKVEVLVNLGSSDYPGLPYLAGEIHEVTEKVGAQLIANGHALAFQDEDDQPEVTSKLIAGTDSQITESESVQVSQESKQEKPSKAALKSSKEK